MPHNYFVSLICEVQVSRSEHFLHGMRNKYNNKYIVLLEEYYLYLYILCIYVHSGQKL